jgi:hypothetical protein
MIAHADQLHAVLERQGAPRQRLPSPCQRCQACAACGLKPLDLGWGAHPGAVRAAPERLDAGGWAIHDAALEGSSARRGILLHALRHAEVAPAMQPRTPAGNGHSGASRVTTVTASSADVRNR